MAFSFKTFARIAAMALVPAGLAGCTSSVDTNPLAFGPIASPRLQSGNALLNELNGGILPKNAVAALSQADKKRALTAEYEALEKAPSGEKIVWQGQTAQASGEVSAGTPYQVGEQNCRQYTHTATINGAPFSAQGAACRNQDGSWTPLT